MSIVSTAFAMLYLFVMLNIFDNNFIDWFYDYMKSAIAFSLCFAALVNLFNVILTKEKQTLTILLAVLIALAIQFVIFGKIDIIVLEFIIYLLIYPISYLIYKKKEIY